MRWILTSLLVGLLLSGCGRNKATTTQADTILRCESVTSNTISGFTVRFRPVDVIKGKVNASMLDSDGLLDLGIEFGDDVAVPKYYQVHLSKKQDRTGIYKNAPLRLLFHYTLINDDNY